MTARKVRSAVRKPAQRIDRKLLQRWPLPALDGQLGKEERGQVLVIGGSTRVPGAVMLAAMGALRAGAGRLQIAISRSVAPAVAVAMPEACVLPLSESRNGELSPRAHRAIHAEIARSNALLVGPGMRDSRLCHALLADCAGTSQATLVVDGAGLSVLASEPRLLANHHTSAVLTPHAGEMAKMCGLSVEQVLEDPEGLAIEQAKRMNAVVVLKGSITYVAAPDGTCYRSTNGNLGLGTSGSGDTLAGIITGLCARGADAVQAAVWGVFLHASAGDVLARDMGGLGYLARELPRQIPSLLATLEKRSVRPKGARKGGMRRPRKET